MVEVVLELSDLKSGFKKINRSKKCMFEDREDRYLRRIRLYEKSSEVGMF